MFIESLTINGIGGINRLDLTLNRGLNLLCGPNGIGKTTVLECIGHSFSHTSSKLLRRNVKSAKGFFSTVIDDNGRKVRVNIEKKDFHPYENEHMSGRYELADKVIVLKTNRILNYTEVNSLQRDPKKEISQCYMEASEGINYQEIKNWFIQRNMWSAHKDALTEEEMANYEFAKECFNLLDKKSSFEKVMIDTYEIIIKMPNGSIYLEYLSSGYKSCLSLLLGLIKEMEFRFKKPKVRAKNFNGIIVIDELDLHLHPEWQSKIATLLKKAFPEAQIIASTHSPHIIQNAESNEIIALESDSTGDVKVKELPTTKFGFQGWTIEEILVDVMGMEDTRSDLYKHTMKSFEDAITDENEDLARKEMDKISEFLHYNNPLRKILRLQLSSISGIKNDKTN